MAFNNNNPIKVIETANKGRTIISTRPLTAGQTILKDSPLLLYSASFSNNSYCSHCFKKTLSIISCPNCSTISFCSSKCQSTAFSTSHTPFVCHSLTRLFAENSPLVLHNHDHQLQARFLVSAINLALIDPSGFQSLLSLQGQNVVGDDENAFVSFIHAIISSVCQVGSSFGFTVEMVSALLAKDKMNAFGLMEAFDGTGERAVRAYGIYPRASFFNHDCLPNACRFDYVDNVGEGNTDIIVRVIHDLPEGREICLSYFPVNLKYKDRQIRLKEDYGFVCDCDRCKVEANWSDGEEEGMDEVGDAMDEEDEDMDENGVEDLETEDIDVGKENDDFPHAYFFMRYMCSKDNCWGTLAPLPPSGASSSSVMECNVCGNLSKSED